jgi:sensor histidine kinase YesM
VSELLRAVLYRSRRTHGTLGEELELAAAYLAIETARFEERLRTVIEVPAELRGLRVPPLLLQPLVENAVKHGIAPRRAGGTVTVAAALVHGAPVTGGDRALRVTVRDSGAGATAERLAEGRARGVGLSNLERRLARYYGDAAALRIHSAPGEGTVVEVWLPADTGVEPTGAAQGLLPGDAVAPAPATADPSPAAARARPAARLRTRP